MNGQNILQTVIVFAILHAFIQQNRDNFIQLPPGYRNFLSLNHEKPASAAKASDLFFINQVSPMASNHSGVFAEFYKITQWFADEYPGGITFCEYPAVTTLSLAIQYLIHGKLI
jgi:hypothetical protein